MLIRYDVNKQPNFFNLNQITEQGTITIIFMPTIGLINVVNKQICSNKYYNNIPDISAQIVLKPGVTNVINVHRDYNDDTELLKQIMLQHSGMLNKLIIITN